jgi:uncharacterized protein YabN with tetrapyrrole methylase and pyrophosphatase domain
MEKAFRSQGQDLEAATREEMDRAWESAKRQTASAEHP